MTEISVRTHEEIIHFWFIGGPECFDAHGLWRQRFDDASDSSLHERRSGRSGCPRRSGDQVITSPLITGFWKREHDGQTFWSSTGSA